MRKELADYYEREYEKTCEELLKNAIDGVQNRAKNGVPFEAGSFCDELSKLREEADFAAKTALSNIEYVYRAKSNEIEQIYCNIFGHQNSLA